LNAYAFAPFGGNLFMTQKAAGKLVELGPAGNLIEPIVNITSATGIVADPATGRLYVSTAFQTFPNIYAIDPGTKSVTQFVGSTDGDGLALSADRKTLYVVIFDQKVVGYDVASRAKVFDSGPIPGGVDGIGLGSGGLAGKAIVTTHAGTLVEVDLKTTAQSVLATGGTRGDTAIADPRGSLLVTQSTSVERLTPPPGSSFLPDLLTGDANGDGSVNFTDLLILAQHFGSTGNWLQGDFDGNQMVDFGDLLALAQDYGLPASGASLSPVPEPCGLPCFAAMVTALSLRRRHNH